ncbi:MAG: PAS domain S-box protein [Bacillota bacterium]
MSLNKKILIITGIIFLCLALSLSAILLFIQTRITAEEEKADAQAEIEHVLRLLQWEIDRLDALAMDWAYWDDTYDFIEDRDVDYVKSNLVDSTFEVLQIDYIILLDLSGGTVFAGGVDWKTGQKKTVPPDLIDYIFPEGPYTSQADAESGIRGLAAISENPVLVAARPILKSDDTGPARGSLVFARCLDDAFVQHLSELAGLPLAFEPLPNADHSNLLQAGLLFHGEPYYLEALSEKEMRGSTLLQDLHGEAALMLAVNMPREIYKFARMAKNLTVAVILLAGIVFAWSTFVLLKQNVITRLERLTRDVQKIGSGPVFSGKVGVLPGGDELTDLSAEINNMLGTLEQAQQQLHKSEERYRLLVENANEAIVILQDGRYRFVNPKAVEIFGRSQEELLSRPVADFIHPEDRDFVLERISKREKKEIFQDKYPVRIVAGDGSIKWIEVNAVVLDWEGRPASLNLIDDITERKKMQQQLQESEEKYRLIFENSPLGVFHIDQKGIVTACNDNFVKIIGSSREALVGLNILALPDKKVAAAAQECLQGRYGFYEGWYHSVTASKVTPVRALFAPFKTEDGSVSGGVCIVEDITERKQAEEKIRYMSFHDSLTGLYNRRFLEEEMQRLDTARQLPISIIMVDLNGLKLVNDTYGHSVGDELLKTAAEILIKSCRKEDILARWGGDEFVILLPQTAQKEARNICKRVKENSSKAYIEDVPVSFALGVAIKENAEKSLADTLRTAEDDMYKQKLAESRSVRSAVLNALLKALEAKSYETEAHTRCMQEVALKIGEKLGLPDSEMSRLKLTITLHDIGKINISEEILTKKGPLTAEEWEIMKKHPETGYRITRATEEFAHVAEEILAHHECWDGSGYPRGLKGKEIPLLARITAIADTYEVMSNGRPYKKALSQSEIVAEFKRRAGTQFDPELVEIFLSLLETGIQQ